MKKIKNDFIVTPNFQKTLSREDLELLIENKKTHICKIIQNTIEHINYCHVIYDNININEYHSCISTLLELYQNTKNQTCENTEDTIDLLKKNIDKLCEIINCFGTQYIEDILFIVFGIECKDKKYDDPILTSKFELIKTQLRPMSYKIINNTNKKYKFRPITNYCENKIPNLLDFIEQTNDLECHDITNIKSFNNKVYGVSVVFQNELHLKTLIIQCMTNNVIIESIDNSYIKHRKLDILKHIPNDKNITLKLVERIIKLITLKEWLILGTNDFYKKIFINFSEINDFINNHNFNENINSFSELDLNSQRNIIINLIAYNNEDQTREILAYSLYEILESDEFGQSKQRMIFNSFPWEIKKNFKNRIEQYNKCHISTNEFNYNTLKKQIYLLKAPEIVKEKAIIKLKEIKEKSDDNSNKPRQYLEGLLKIPFSVYKEEPFLQKTNEINKQFILLLKTYDIFSNIIESKEHYTNIEILECIFSIKNQLLEMIKINVFELIKKSQNKYLTDVINYIQNECNESYHPKIKQKSKQDKIKTIDEIINVYFENIKSNEESENETTKKKLFNIFDILNISSNDRRISKSRSPENGSSPATTLSDEFLNYSFKTTLKFSLLKIEKELNHIIDLIKDTDKQLHKIQNILDDSIHGHSHAKKQIMKIIGQWMSGEQSGYCFGFEGSPGIGKTSFAKNGLSKCLIDEKGISRPFSFISIGGSCNGSILEGHNYTYANSSWGKIVDILMDAKCMNPIIYIDELDKVSKTENGKELIGILTHLVDTTQNDLFQDKYFTGINIDLSKVLFIFSYNNPESIDPILLDRIHRIKFDNLDTYDKLTIVQKFIIPEMNSKMSFHNIININSDTLEYIIENYTQESGVRKLKEIIFDLFGDINLEILKCDPSIKIPITISVNDLENKYMKKKTKVNLHIIDNEDKIGVINGLWANMYGRGGVIPIEVMFFPSSTFLELKLTGLQGEVMKESMNVAKTLAWNLTSDETKKDLLNYFENTKCQGLHINCPYAGVSKDGPSAGAAITIAIYSLFNKLKIKNNVAITGEINLQGNICQIGGLDVKIHGGIKAGITTFLFPKSNENDFLIFTDKVKNQKILINTKFHSVKNIKEIFSFIF